MKSETLAAKAVEKTLRGKVQKQTFPPLLEIPQKRGIPTFHTASTATGYSFLGGLTGADPNRRNWLPLSPALTPNSTESYSGGAFALVRAGDFSRAEELLKEATKRYPPQHTLFNNVSLPSIRAAIALGTKKPDEAIQQLQGAAGYDFTHPPDILDGGTMYYRGVAYLELHSGNEAAEQFQKLLDNPGTVSIGILRPLAHLGLARAYAITGDKDKSLAQYREFLALWKNADPDLRILREAKTEYETLNKSTP